MKKFAAIFLVLVFVFSFVGCSSTAKEEPATTMISEEVQVSEVMQWVMVNVMNKHSDSRLVNASLYDEVKAEIENYKNSLPFYVEINIEKPSFVEDFFEIEIIF